LAGESNRLHTKFQQDITQTGRLSSSEPNLQNIPARTELGREIRTAFVARNNKLIVNADYSQFELRLAAALAGDTNLIEDFQDDDIDIHTKTAAEAFGRAMEDVSEAERRAAKVINFGVLYGMSPRGLSQATDMSMVEAKDFIDRYFRLRQPIRDLINKTVHQAEIEGYVETLFGRRRLTPDVKSPVYVVREAAKRAAANMPIQGTEADLMKMAMLRIEREIPEAEQFMQIHDSIMVECDPQAAEMVGKKMKQIMENIYPSIGVRLKVDIKIGKNWSKL
jgi:DNA polymerase-1